MKSSLGLAIVGLALAGGALAGMAFADDDHGGAAVEPVERQEVKTTVTRDGRFAYVGANSIPVPAGGAVFRLACPKKGHLTGGFVSGDPSVTTSSTIPQDGNDRDHARDDVLAVVFANTTGVQQVAGATAVCALAKANRRG